MERTTNHRTVDNPTRRRGRVAGLIAGSTLLAAASIACGQAAERAIVVGNDGNLEGSISSMLINPDGSLTLVDHLVTGERESIVLPCPGCNAYTISLTPDGRFLAAGHPSSSNFPRHLSITRVNPDATLELIDLYQVPGSPLSVDWVSNNILAVTRTDFGGINEVRTYHFDEVTGSLTFVDSEVTGGFSSSITVDRDRGMLYAQRTSGGNALFSYSVATDGTLTPLDTLPTGTTFPLGIGVAPDGSRIYGGGGISNGGNKIVGASVDPDTGAMELLAGSPFVSPGASPKQVVIAPNGQYAIVGHGTDATVRTFTVDQKSGSLAPTGSFFDVGLQGSLGDINVLDNLVFFTDNTTAVDGIMGVYSFTLGSDGTLIQNSNIVSSGGIAPRAIAAWSPAADCPEDLTGTGTVDVFDLLLLLSAWGDCPGCDADLNGDGVVDVFDLMQLLDAWGDCP